MWLKTKNDHSSGARVLLSKQKRDCQLLSDYFFYWLSYFSELVALKKPVLKKMQM